MSTDVLLGEVAALPIFVGLVDRQWIAADYGADPLPLLPVREAIRHRRRSGQDRVCLPAQEVAERRLPPPRVTLATLGVPVWPWCVATGGQRRPGIAVHTDNLRDFLRIQLLVVRHIHGPLSTGHCGWSASSRRRSGTRG